MKEAKSDIFEWIELGNTKKLHSAFGDKKPVEFKKIIDFKLY